MTAGDCREWFKLGPDAAARTAAYRRLFEERIDQFEIDTIRTCIQQGKPFGDEHFHKALEATLKRPITSLPRVGPAVIA